MWLAMMLRYFILHGRLNDDHEISPAENGLKNLFVICLNFYVAVKNAMVMHIKLK